MKLKTSGTALGLLALVAFIDYLTGFEMMFHVFYFIPVAFVAGHEGKGSTLTMAALAAVAWGLVDWADGHSYSREILRYWNAFTCFVSFVCIGWLMLQLREAVAESNRLAQAAVSDLDKLKESTVKIHELEGSFKVMCAWTNQIKDEGKWIPIEDFLARHFKMTLTPGISPEGMKKMLRRQAEE